MKNDNVFDGIISLSVRDNKKYFEKNISKILLSSKTFFLGYGTKDDEFNLLGKRLMQEKNLNSNITAKEYNADHTQLPYASLSDGIKFMFADYKYYDNLIKKYYNQNFNYQEFEKIYSEIKNYAIARDIYTETTRHAEILTVGLKLYQLEQLYKIRGEQPFNDRRMVLINGLGDFYKNYNAEVDQHIFEKLIAIYSKNYPKQFLSNSLNNIDGEILAKDVFTKSQLVSYEKIKGLLTGDTKSIIEKLNNDIGYQIVKSIAEAHFTEVAPMYNEINLKISATQQSYMKAILEMSKK